MSRRRASMTWIAILGLSASVLTAASSTGAAVSHSSFTPKLAHAEEGGGPGWILATWNRLRGGRGYATEKVLRRTPQYVFLLGPDGERDLIGQLPNSLAYLADWSGDGSRALFVNGDTISEFDLASASSIDSFTLPKNINPNFEQVSFTKPRGLALLLSFFYGTGANLRRYSLSGKLLLDYPRRFSRVGAYNGSYLSRPDGEQLVFGASRGLALVDNDGAVVAQYGVHGETYCRPVNWWATNVVLASCSVRQGRGSTNRLVEVDLGTGALTVLTYPKPPDLGDFNAWAIPSGVYVQFSPGCGEFLGKVTPAHHTTPVYVPGFREDEMGVIGAFEDKLALFASNGCVGGSTILWFSPSINTTTPILGPPVTGGNVLGAVLFPDQ